MSFRLKFQPVLSSLCLSAGFALLSTRKPVNVFETCVFAVYDARIDAGNHAFRLRQVLMKFGILIP